MTARLCLIAGVLGCLVLNHGFAQEDVATQLGRSLDSYPDQPPPLEDYSELAKEPFAKTPLTQEQAARCRGRLIDAFTRSLQAERAAEMEAGVIKLGKLEMPFTVKRFGDAPVGSRSMFISMHGGGGAPRRVNDQQWKNQQRLYQLEEGFYVVPRAPTDTWNLWHQAHVDKFFSRLIQNMVALRGVDPDRVYVMGYSAGGDGVYQLAPRMADRWAAAAMMAGHPNETSPLGLRNVPFALQVGELDTAYNRSKQAELWQERLAQLQSEDPAGYVHLVKIHAGKAHWMDRDDRLAIPWMAAKRRDPVPQKVVWVQDDVTHRQFYWLHSDEPIARSQATVSITGQEITIDADQNVKSLSLLLDDRMLDLDKAIIIRKGETAAEVMAQRTLGTMLQSLLEKGDPELCFSARVDVVD
ncbi:MAG TPA: alpha/beta hydrolase [Planctomycetaceae bacterium]|nr:alpha/beta hydrolase [Planctomycetaceae bacterium]